MPASVPIKGGGCGSLLDCLRVSLLLCAPLTERFRIRAYFVVFLELQCLEGTVAVHTFYSFLTSFCYSFKFSCTFQLARIMQTARLISTEEQAKQTRLRRDVAEGQE